MVTDHQSMPDFMAADRADYERAFAKLLKEVQQLQARTKQPAISKEIKALVLRAQKLLDTTRGHGAGYFPNTLSLMQQMVDAAAREADAMPPPRVKEVLPFAAKGLVRLRHAHAMMPPPLGDSSEAVIELAKLCEAANSYYAPVTLRNALSAALREFDGGSQFRAYK